MDLIIIENNLLSVSINRVGAEITSIINKKTKDNIIWEGKTHWQNHAPVLFPIVGGLIDNEFIYSDKSFTLNRHGFTRYNESFKLVYSEINKAVYKLESDESTLECYPFKFSLIISFILKGNKLEVRHEVKNLDDKSMYYSIGGHPAFSLSEDISEYSLKFEKREEFVFPLLNEKGQRTNEKVEFGEDNDQITLNENSFNKDAWIFEKPNSSWIELSSEKSDNKVLLHMGDFKQLGIWSKPGAPYVCLEPWLGVADHESHNKKIEDKEYILNLSPDQLNVHSFTIEVI